MIQEYSPQMLQSNSIWVELEKNNKIKNPSETIYSIYVHPDNLNLLKTITPINESLEFGVVQWNKTKIHVAPHYPRDSELWEPPTELYFKYEYSDEKWCKKLGIGKIFREPALFVIKNDIQYAKPQPIFKNIILNRGKLSAKINMCGKNMLPMMINQIFMY